MIKEATEKLLQLNDMNWGNYLKRNVDKVKNLITEDEMDDIMGYVSIDYMLPPHEMFYFLEEYDNRIYTRTK